jgi:hypothetical protein
MIIGNNINLLFSGGFCFLGCLCYNRERVESRLKLVGQRIIDQTVAFNETLPVKLRRHDLHVEVSLSFRGASDGGMASVLVRHVVDLQSDCFQ